MIFIGRRYKELKKKYDNLTHEYEELLDELEKTLEENEVLRKEKKALQDDLDFVDTLKDIAMSAADSYSEITEKVLNQVIKTNNELSFYRRISAYRKYNKRK